MINCIYCPISSSPISKFAVPADGVKGKTWGPSTVHQRSRTQLPLGGAGAAGPLVPLAPRPRHARFSSSAPDLPPATRSAAGNRPAAPARPARPARPAPTAPSAPHKRSGSHDDLLADADEPRRNRFFLCPMFTSTADLPHEYEAVFAVRGRARRRAPPLPLPPLPLPHLPHPAALLRSLRSSSVGLLAADTADLLADD